MDKICDVVFEGGGIRGIGLVGAVSALEKSGYLFRKLAGSSAGAIVASLLAAGYTADEMHAIMSELNFEQFKEKSFLSGFGAVGKLVSAATTFGIYSAAAFEQWLGGLLAQKGVITFADLKKTLKVTASDITSGKIIILPDDLPKFGYRSESFKVSAAVRMSMSIPFFYEPYELKDLSGNIHYIVDGGMLSNYPIWIFDDGVSVPQCPVFGMRFIKQQSNTVTRKTNVMEYVKQIVTTFMEAHDGEYQSRAQGDLERTIYISTQVGDKHIGTTDFDISKHQTQELYKNGYSAGRDFLKSWNYLDWGNRFRK